MPISEIETTREAAIIDLYPLQTLRTSGSLHCTPEKRADVEISWPNRQNT